MIRRTRKTPKTCEQLSCIIDCRSESAKRICERSVETQGHGLSSPGSHLKTAGKLANFHIHETDLPRQNKLVGRGQEYIFCKVPNMRWGDK